MPINPNYNPHLAPPNDEQLEAWRRGSLGPTPVDARDVISGKVDGRPTWHCAALGCNFKAPLGSREQEKHPGTHTRKLTADERRQAEADEATRLAIFPKSIECGCGRLMKPGDPPHRCNGFRDTGPMSIDVSAAAHQREGLKRALVELEQES